MVEANVFDLRASKETLNKVIWSAKSGPDVALVFRQTFLLQEVCHEEEAVFNGADRCRAQAGRDRGFPI